MDIGKTGATLFRMYTGAVVLMWAVLLIVGGGLLLYTGFEPFRVRAFVMIGVGAVILGLSLLSMTGALSVLTCTQLTESRSHDGYRRVHRTIV